MLGWQFCAQDRRLRYRDGRIIKTGRTYRVSRVKPLELCKYGLHASRRLIDALSYAPSPILCRVELVGEIVHRKDKSLAYERRVLGMADVSNLLHEAACRFAERALRRANVVEGRCWAAIRMKRRWLAGKATDKELAAARAAARAAAWDAWDACDACDAAWDAVAAANKAAEFAAKNAARDAEQMVQNRILTGLISRHTQLMVKA